jgi:hypothetical protein
MRLDMRQGSCFAKVNWFHIHADVGFGEDDEESSPGGSLSLEMMALMEPGGWRREVKAGQELIIQGSRFKVVHNDTYIPDDHSSVLTEESPLSDLDTDEKDEDSDSDSGSDSESEDDAKSAKSVESAQQDSVFTPGGTVGKDHVRLSRPWLLPSVDGLMVYIPVARTILSAPLFKLYRFAFRSMPVQKVVQVSFLCIQIYKCLSLLVFDETSHHLS